MKWLWLLAKDRARERGIEFAITAADIVIPEMCPVFGTRLTPGTPTDKDNSPSLDRLDPGRGYVPGNVVVMSYRANRIKNDGTAAEHRAIAAFLEASGP